MTYLVTLREQLNKELSVEEYYLYMSYGQLFETEDGAKKMAKKWNNRDGIDLHYNVIKIKGI